MGSDYGQLILLSVLIPVFPKADMDLQLDPEPDSDEDSDMYSDDGPSGGEDGDGDVDIDGDDEQYGEDGRPGKRKSLGGSAKGGRKRRDRKSVV